MTIKELTALPKVELHCHLDGSLSHGFIEKRLGRKVSQSELSVSEDCRSLNEYLEKFDLPGKCIMDETGLKEAGYDVLKSMKQENVCYAEIRFAPLLSETPDMNCNKVIEALLAGLEKGKRDFGIEYGVITCAMRHHSEEENARMLRTAREYLGHGVCAADLAGAESLYPMSEFMELFKKTKALGMPFTLHAGECGSVQNILDSVEAGAGRIGHGIAMRGHADIQKELQKKGIGIPQRAEDLNPLSDLPLEVTWAAMEKLQGEGSVESIGVSNFTAKKLGDLIEKAEIVPAVNQIENHPLLQQNDLIDFCHKNNIEVTAYSPLGSQPHEGQQSVLENPVIQEIAERIKATPAQVVLAWQMQRGVAVIPKSVHEAHLRENYASLAIELDEADMAKIATLDKNYRFISGDAFANGSYANLWDEAN